MSKFSFSPPPTPTNLVTNEEIVVINNRAVNQVQLSWDVDIGVNNYRLAYFFNSDIKGSPYPQVIGTGYTLVDVTGNSYSINGIGRGYLNIFIYGIIKGGIASNTPLRAQIHTLGKVAPPENVSGFRVEKQGDDFVKLNWTKATEADVLNGGYVEFRFTSLTSNATWEGAMEVGKVAAINTQAILNIDGSGTFLAKFVDDGGRKSSTTASSVVEYFYNPHNRLFEGTSAEQSYSSDWVGLTTTYLTADSSSNMSLVNASDKSEGIKLTNASTKTGTYVFATGWYIGAAGSGFDVPYTFEIERNIKMTTFYETTSFSGRGEVALMDSFSGTTAPNVNVRFYYKTTLSSVSGRDNATWSDWIEFTKTRIRGTGFTFKVVVETTDPAQNIKITELGVSFYFPFRVLSTNSSLNITTTGYDASQATTNGGGSAADGDGYIDITYYGGGEVGTASAATAFWQNPNLQVTGWDLDAGEYFQLSNTSRSGFRIKMRKSNGEDITSDRVFSFLATGYGHRA